MRSWPRAGTLQPPTGLVLPVLMSFPCHMRSESNTTPKKSPGCSFIGGSWSEVRHCVTLGGTEKPTRRTAQGGGVRHPRSQAPAATGEAPHQVR